MVIDSTTLRNELAALTHELGRLLPKPDGAHHDRHDGQSIVGPVDAAMVVLRTSLTKSHVEQSIRSRPIMATASAFALGTAFGLLLRRT